MSLNWSTENCPDGGTPANDREDYEREALIWSTMTVGLRGPTEKNIAEYRRRLLIADKVYGGGPNAEGAWSRTLTPAVLWRWRGLTTNVTEETKAAWKNRLWKALDEDADSRADREWREFSEALHREEEPV